MPHPERPAKLRRHRAAVSLLALCMLVAGCESKRNASGEAKQPAPSEAEVKLAAARQDLARQYFIDQDNRALTVAVSALSLDPMSSKARSLAAGIIATRKWRLPECVLSHGMPVDHVHFAPPSTLWVSLRGAKNTTVRWNLDELRIENVLFPVEGDRTRSLVFNSTHDWMVVERAGVTLLCNAKTLRPVRDLGPLPHTLTPSSAIAFSPNGLLIAHPTLAGADESSVIWNLHDTQTGEILRSSEPSKPGDPRPLAAFLDREALRVLRQDGSVWKMPVSPINPVELTAPGEKADFLNARFADNGGWALVLRDRGPHRPPTTECLRLGGGDDSSLAPARLIEAEPWTRQPCLWTGLYREAPLAPQIRENEIKFPIPDVTLQSTSPITAAAFAGDRSFIADHDGNVTLDREIPRPHYRKDKATPGHADARTLSALRNLSELITGVTSDPSLVKFSNSTLEQRLKAFEACDFNAIQRFIPELDFAPLIAAVKDFRPRHAAPEALAPLADRLARATAATPNPDLIEAFDDLDDKAVRAAITSAGPKGAAAAKALELALASTHPEWIEACLQQVKDLPPLLRGIAVSRIAWLQDRKADAIAGWPDVFPDLQQVRLREDWDGWEQADFSQALEKLRLCVSDELTAIQVPEHSTPEQRKAVVARLTDPATARAVGRERFAKACLKAALALSSFKDETAATFQLASVARNLGEDPAPCLRAEAISLTALGDYQKARERWVELITEHPVASQQPGDYAEAAYTSFENADPRQAMEILITGLHRFPKDANFALRAGWVALLTGNAERAYRFLLTGRQIGYPPEKLENATALLAIAAEQTGATEDADVFYQDLIRLDDDWRKPETIDSLDWPDELKASLHRLLP